MSIFAQHNTVHIANGIKVGEVNQTSAIIWTRLTQKAERHLQGTVWETAGLPAGSSLHDMQDTVAGTKGQVQVTWSLDGKVIGTSDWLSVDPEKTIWGKEHKEWFKRTVKESNATFRILISPTPVVGPDRGNKNDNHANKGFTHEGDEIRSFISTQKNMFIICGDRHWQYVSVDPKTGVKEFSCGPTSDKHAGGFSKKYKSPMHRYLKVKGGFLGVEVKRVNDKPVAIFRHYGVDGSVYNEETIKNEK